MDAENRKKFSALIAARLEELDASAAAARQGGATVELDQQKVGRLSRMDALQNQAMARASSARADAERTRLRAALDRVEDGSFGLCEDCGEPIAEKRLEFDPSARLCIECQRG